MDYTVTIAGKTYSFTTDDELIGDRLAASLRNAEWARVWFLEHYATSFDAGAFDEKARAERMSFATLYGARRDEICSLLYVAVGGSHADAIPNIVAAHDALRVAQGRAPLLEAVTS